MLNEREASTSSKQKQLLKPPKRKPGKPITSCAECRRSKLKCDGKVPCSTCVLRGCKSICPDMALSARRKYTYVLEGTDALHDRIETLVNRVDSLERALQEFHSSHPLLDPQLLQIKTSRIPSPPRNDVPTASSSTLTIPMLKVQEGEEVTVKEELVEAFGTLKLSTSGEESTYFGHTTRTDHLKLQDEPQDTYSSLPESILDLARGALTHPNEDALVAEIIGRLPPIEETIALCEGFVSHSEYNYGLLLPRRELFEEVIEPIYQSYPYTGNLTNLGLLYIVLAFGTTFSLNLPNNSAQRHDYFRLALATTKLTSVARQTTLNKIRLLAYIANYHHSSRQMGSNHEAWLIANEAMKTAISAGLHVNSQHFNLPPALLNERHRLFWSVFLTDTIMSVNVGRPPALPPVYIECPLPTDIADWQRWTINYLSFLHEIIAAILGSKIPPYQEILQLDKKLRDFPIPNEMRHEAGQSPGGDSRERLYMKHTLPFYIHIAILLLHKRYLAVALRDADNLPRHKYMPSVTAAFRAASDVINRVWACWFDQAIRPIIERGEIIWSYVLLAIVTMCQIATKAPASEFAPLALQFLDSSESLLANASATCPFAGDNLLLVRAMRQKAAATLNLYRQSGTVDNRSTAILDEVDRIGGKTHLHVNQPAPPPPVMDPAANWDLEQFAGGEQENAEGQLDNYRTDALERFAQTDTFVEAQNIHPSLVHDMGFFAGHSVSRDYSRSFPIQVQGDGSHDGGIHAGYFPAAVYSTPAQEWHESAAPGNPGLEVPRQGTTSSGNPMPRY